MIKTDREKQMKGVTKQREQQYLRSIQKVMKQRKKVRQERL